MSNLNLSNFLGGWFIGNFTPTLLDTNNFEVGIKQYKAGTYEDTHFHKVATEYTIIVNGQAKMNNKIYKNGDIVIINPNQKTDFFAITDVITVVIKTPSVKDDKYF
jgi:quercetin dioxygenase-like cupin family protein